MASSLCARPARLHCLSSYITTKHDLVQGISSRASSAGCVRNQKASFLRLSLFCTPFPERILSQFQVPDLESHSKRSVCSVSAASSSPPGYGSQVPYTPADASEDAVEAARRAQASKRVEQTGAYIKRLGVFSFWTQLACSIVSAVILAFSLAVTGKPTSPPTTYLTAFGIAAALFSVFWTFGYLRLAERLRDAASNPVKAPSRASVVATLKRGVVINLVGMGATLLGLQSTVGQLVAKALTTSYQPFAAGVPAGYSPVIALDVFLVQACGNTVLAHFIGLVFSLELLRATTANTPPQDPSAVRPVS
eukprot:TRINITY_DN4223_c0_g1_i1.p1 TRINITY_DN4223_c0_g1~~TRINITY_DN4223_c0_g1_i1.p1  ORF type:complete len:327 (+),score=69.15 TRINITY_DN4223_c0_g1_i1:62-982(+)